MANRICHLTLLQASEYERTGKEPDCAHHTHVKIFEAHEMVDAQREGRQMIEGYGTARWVGSQFKYICDIPERTWINVESNYEGQRGGVGVLQMVAG